MIQFWLVRDTGLEFLSGEDTLMCENEWVDVLRKPKPVSALPPKTGEALDRILDLARDQVKRGHDFVARKQTTLGED